MSQATTRTGWTFEEYMEWEPRQSTKYEFVDGRVYAMVGSTARHDVICNNLRGELWNQLRGRPCRLQGPDLKLRAGNNVRYPDALVDCGPHVESSLFAQQPVAVFEVLSKSTAWIDQTIKLRDYDSVASIHSYVLISQDEPRVVVYTRSDAGHLSVASALLLEGLSAALDLTDPDIHLPLQTLYEGVELEP